MTERSDSNSPGVELGAPMAAAGAMGSSQVLERDERPEEPRRPLLPNIYQHHGKRTAAGPDGDDGRWGHIFAALDMGTNNCRLLIARPRQKGFSVIDAFSRTICLGEGIGATGELQPAAMDRALAALKACATKMERRRVSVARSIATEACRSAGNRHVFLSRVRQETGLEFDVISPAEEARLAVMGCWPLVDRKCETALVFDIGGGSTELIWVEIGGRGVKPRIAAWTSLPSGVVTLSEKFGTPNLEPACYEAMVTHVQAQIEAFTGADYLRPRFGTDRVHLLGTSGTLTTLAGIHLGLIRYDRSKVDGTWLDATHVDEMCAELAATSFEDRLKLPCIGKERADYILAGCAILDAVRRLWPAPRLRVADRGLREGMLFSLMAQADRATRRRLTGRD